MCACSGIIAINYYVYQMDHDNANPGNSLQTIE